MLQNFLFIVNDSTLKIKPEFKKRARKHEEAFYVT